MKMMNNDLILNLSNEEDVFNTSSSLLFDAPTNIDTDNLLNLVQEILVQRFQNPDKQLIEKYSNRITFSCP